MFRTRILGAMLAAGALVLAACGSNSDGTPSAAESPTSSASESAAEEEAETDAADETDASDDTDTGGSDSSGSVTPAALDDQSAAWFSTFCGIAEPFDNFFGTLMSAAMAGSGGNEASPEELATLRDSLVGAFGDLGSAMTTVSGELANMPPPTMEGGTEAAQKAVEGLAQGGPYLAGVGEQMKNVDTSSAEAFSAAMDQLMDSVGDMENSLGVEDIHFDEATEAAIQELPACAGSMLMTSLTP